MHSRVIFSCTYILWMNIYRLLCLNFRMYIKNIDGGDCHILYQYTYSIYGVLALFHQSMCVGTNISSITKPAYCKLGYVLFRALSDVLCLFFIVGIWTCSLSLNQCHFEYAGRATEFIIYELHDNIKIYDIQNYQISMMLKWMTNKNCTTWEHIAYAKRTQRTTKVSGLASSVCICSKNRQNCRKFAET